MLLEKTEKARAELRPGVRTLGQRERTVLLLADGTRTAADLASFFDGEAPRIAARLITDGYLMEQPASGPLPRVTQQANPAVVAAAQPAPRAPAASAGSPAPRVNADSFEGKRSLATTRMFLFDLCERMFARRDPALASAFREALRQAGDRDSMLAVAREMIGEIERIAGPERADFISERIAMLLPEMV